MVASFSTGNTVIYDLETSQSMVTVSSQVDSGKLIQSNFVPVPRWYAPTKIPSYGLVVPLLYLKNYTLNYNLFFSLILWLLHMDQKL